jgi:hypothetical protein
MRDGGDGGNSCGHDDSGSEGVRWRRSALFFSFLQSTSDAECEIKLTVLQRPRVKHPLSLCLCGVGIRLLAMWRHGHGRDAPLGLRHLVRLPRPRHRR